MTQADDWSDYWRKEGVEGEVFLDGAGGKHPELESHWRTVFSALEPAQAIVDIACGGGSIFTAIASEAAHDLHGVDVSDEALKVCAARHPNVTLHLSSAEELPLADASMDMAVSQFGIEYAPDKLKAFAAAAQCVRPGGRIDCLCHHQGGFIDQKIAPAYRGTRAVLETNFVDNAKALALTKAQRDDQAFTLAKRLFIDSERVVANAMREAPSGIHVHLYGGFKEMFSKFERYAADEIVQWLSAMHEEITRADARYAQMAQAAMSDAQIRDIEASLLNAGRREASAEPSYTLNTELPLAMGIRATR